MTYHSDNYIRNQFIDYLGRLHSKIQVAGTFCLQFASKSLSHREQKNKQKK